MDDVNEADHIKGVLLGVGADRRDGIVTLGEIMSEVNEGDQTTNRGTRGTLGMSKMSKAEGRGLLSLALVTFADERLEPLPSNDDL